MKGKGQNKPCCFEGIFGGKFLPWQPFGKIFTPEAVAILLWLQVQLSGLSTWSIHVPKAVYKCLAVGGIEFIKHLLSVRGQLLQSLSTSLNFAQT